MALTTEQAERAAGRRLLVGDPLRGYAALAIVAFHTAAAALLLRGDGADFSAGFGRVGGVLVESLQYGAYVFFALSAYLLGRPWVAAAMGRAPWPDAGVYLVRRLARIVPAFWVACGIIVLFYGLQGSGGRQLVALLAFAQVYDLGTVAGLIGHGWSLDVELLFYLALPVGAVLAASAAGRASRSRARLALGVAVVLALAAAGYALRDAGLDGGTPSVHSPLGELRAFLPGLLVAALDVAYGPRAVGWRPGPRVALALAAAGGALIALTLAVTSDVSTWSIPPVAVGGAALLAGVLLLQRSSGGAWRVLDNRVAHWIGERSYSIFLLHGIPVYEGRRIYAEHGGSVAAGAALAFVPIVVASCVGAYVLHRLVEVPFRTLAHRGRQAAPAVT